MKKIVLIGLIILIIAGIGGYLIGLNSAHPTQESKKTVYENTTIQQLWDFNVT